MVFPLDILSPAMLVTSSYEISVETNSAHRKVHGQDEKKLHAKMANGADARAFIRVQSFM